MPVHDWTRVEAGIFHDFHSAWVTELRNVLNGGLLPQDYYALAEQHTGRMVADVLTLHADPSPDDPSPDESPLPASGGLALAEAPPRVSRRLSASASYRQLRRTLAIRHVSGHRLVALVEIVSPRAQHVAEFVSKARAAIELGVHVLLADLFPPRKHDPRGMHGAIWAEFDDEPYELPSGKPLTLASYQGSVQPEVFLEHLAVGQVLPDMPLFLRFERYINVPLEPSYQAAFRGVPAIWRRVLESPLPPAD